MCTVIVHIGAWRTWPAQGYVKLKVDCDVVQSEATKSIPGARFHRELCPRDITRATVIYAFVRLHTPSIIDSMHAAMRSSTAMASHFCGPFHYIQVYCIHIYLLRAHFTKSLNCVCPGWLCLFYGNWTKCYICGRSKKKSSIVGIRFLKMDGYPMSIEKFYDKLTCIVHHESNYFFLCKDLLVYENIFSVNLDRPKSIHKNSR